VILSGGLTAENVAAGIAAVDPWAVDVSSGVEAAPGVKDHAKLDAFMGAARPAARRGRRVTVVEHRFGPYGGQYVPETLMPALAELEDAWIAARADPGYRAELARLSRDFCGRPTPLYHAARLSEAAGRPGVAQARGPDAHGLAQAQQRAGPVPARHAHGQAAHHRRDRRRPARRRTATACALLGLECVVYMGTEDMRRQAPNVQRMRLLGTTVSGVDAGSRTLKEAVSAGDPRLGRQRRPHPLRDRVVRRPAPFPALVRDLQRVIGDEAARQVLERCGRLPRA
jgi:tryptophan synthase beta chain